MVEIGRDENGRVLPGTVLNPNGRPKGISITEMVREQLKEFPSGSRETYGQLIVKKILVKAIKDGDVQLIKAIWNYMDGLPRQNIEIKGSMTTNNIRMEKLTDEQLEQLSKITESASDTTGTEPETPA